MMFASASRACDRVAARDSAAEAQAGTSEEEEDRGGERAQVRSRGRGGIRRALPSNEETPTFAGVLRLELAGLEPATSCMPCRPPDPLISAFLQGILCLQRSDSRRRFVRNFRPFPIGLGQGKRLWPGPSRSRLGGRWTSCLDAALSSRASFEARPGLEPGTPRFLDRHLDHDRGAVGPQTASAGRPGGVSRRRLLEVASSAVGRWIQWFGRGLRPTPRGSSAIGRIDVRSITAREVVPSVVELRDGGPVWWSGVRERSGLLDGRGVSGGALGGEVALDGDRRAWRGRCSR